MAKKDEINLDDLDLDSFDFDVPEFDGEGVEDSSSRKPIERVLKGVVHGAKNELTSVSSLRTAMSLAMPEGYSLAADTLENIATDTRSLYDKVAGDSPELVRSSKSFGRKAMNLLGNKVLPKKVADRLNNALEEGEDYKVTSEAQYRREQEESELAALAEIFKAKAAADEERSDQDAVENVERKALEQARLVQHPSPQCHQSQHGTVGWVSGQGHYSLPAKDAGTELPSVRDHQATDGHDVHCDTETTTIT